MYKIIFLNVQMKFFIPRLFSQLNILYHIFKKISWEISKITTLFVNLVACIG